MNILKSIYNKFANKTEIQYNISLIDGPPGTGKSRLISQIILQLLFGATMKIPVNILVCASSNNAVDVIAKKLIHARQKVNDPNKRQYLKFVRIGKTKPF